MTAAFAAGLYKPDGFRTKVDCRAKQLGSIIDPSRETLDESKVSLRSEQIVEYVHWEGRRALGHDNFDAWRACDSFKVRLLRSAGRTPPSTFCDIDLMAPLRGMPANRGIG